MIYKICEFCGATLDPGERCNCRDFPFPEQADDVSRKIAGDDKDLFFFYASFENDKTNIKIL